MPALTFDLKVGKTVCIGEDVRVTVVRRGGGGMRLRFEAPASVEVDRAEVREHKEREGRRAKPADPEPTFAVRRLDGGRIP